MKLKQLIAFILCAAVLFAAFVGCRGADEPEDLDDNPIVDVEPTAEPPDSGNTHGIDLDAAIATFAPDTVMIKAGEFVLTWVDLYAFIFDVASNITQSFLMPVDWSEVPPGADSTYAELLLEYATEEAISLLVYEHGAKVMGFTLSADDLEMFNADLESWIDMHGGNEAFEKVFREERGYYSLELYERHSKILFTVGRIMTDLYGEEVDLFPDEGVAEFVEREGYMSVKHILRISEDDEGTALAEIEVILDQLSGHIDNDDLFDVFDALMNESSDDPGAASFPDGYLFNEHDGFVTPFVEASEALDIGELSGIVETDFGYHIILRLPIDFDRVPDAYVREGLYRTLRQLAALEDFYEKLQGWRDDLNIEFTPEYDSIDIAAIFAWS